MSPKRDVTEPKREALDPKRIALLRVRTAMRFRSDEYRPPRPSRNEAREEQAASGQHVPFRVFEDLIAEGMIERIGVTMRLTAAGLAAIAREDDIAEDDAAYLRDLAERISHIAAMHGVDQSDSERLECIASKIDVGKVRP